MQSNNQERITEGTAACEACGHGYTPDERMDFEGSTINSLIQSAHDHLAGLQDKVHTIECILAKLMEMGKAAA